MKYQNTFKTLLLGALLTLATTACQNGFLSGGNGEGPNGSTGTEPDDPTKIGGNIGAEGPECQPLDRFYLREIYAPALKGACESCHGLGGEGALKSDFVLYNRGRADYLQVNLGLTKEFAQITRDGESILLLKPLGKVSHGGGQVIEEGDDVYNRLKAFVEVIKTTTDEGCADDIDDSFFEGIDLLDTQQTMRKATLNLAGRLPTAEELASDDLDSVLDGMMTEEVFYDRMTEHWNDLLLTDQYMPNDDAIQLLDEDQFPTRMFYEDMADDDARNTARNGANFGLTREPLALINHVVRNDRPFTEILTADYTLVNPMSAQSYGLQGLQFADNTDRNEFVEAVIPGIPHAGLLSNSVYMNKHPTTETNRNRHRAFVFQQYFLATNILTIAERPIDAVLVDQTQTPTLFSENCTGCHTQIEPIAGAFQNWDVDGVWNPSTDTDDRDGGWYTDMFPAGFSDIRLADEDKQAALPWLASVATADQRFAYAAIEHAYSLTTGGNTLSLPSDATRADYEAQFRAYEVQVEFFKTLVENFIDNNYNFKTLIKDIVKSEFFRAYNATGVEGQRALEVAELGTTTLLGPERLHRKIEATTGVAWNVDGRDQLLSANDFRFLYGGIDSISTTTRMTELNSIAASIARRMSNEVSCLATANDFDKPAAERLLFPDVEVANTDEATVRAGISHIQWQLLGERVDPNDEEVTRVLNLFNTVRNDYETNGDQGLAGRCQAGGINNDDNYTVKSWMAVVSYTLADYRFLHD